MGSKQTRGRHCSIILDSKQTCILEKIVQNNKAVSVSAHKIFKNARDLWRIVFVQVEDRKIQRMSAWENKNLEMKEYNRAVNTVTRKKIIASLQKN